LHIKDSQSTSQAFDGWRWRWEKQVHKVGKSIGGKISRTVLKHRWRKEKGPAYGRGVGCAKLLLLTTWRRGYLRNVMKLRRI
jgi:hypothetical protein